MIKYEGMSALTFREWCEKEGKEQYIQQWDREMNNEYTPDDFSYGSTKRIYWRCEKGHIWNVSINNRTSVEQSNCPFCSGKKLSKGYNDLETLYPNVAKEWDYELNDKIPSEYFGSSNYKVHWICVKGHRYEAKINDRTKSRGTGCPYCAGNKILIGYNDLKTLFPQFEKEWDYKKNNRHIESVSPHSGYKAWWICHNNHSYAARVSDRTKTKGTGCPYCSGRKVLQGYNDISYLFPNIAEEWDYEKNYPLTPDNVTKGKKEKFWWKCKYNHSWKATLSSRCNLKTGCPYCAGEKTIIGINDLQTLYPRIAEEWNYEKNSPIKPKEVMPNCGKKYWWRCNKGHEWEVSPNSRVSSETGCPICSKELHTSFPEQAIYYYISKYENVVNRYIIEKNEIDIFMPDYGIAIEYDGIFYHSSLEAKKREQRKNEYLQNKGIVLIRVKETEEDIPDKDNIIYRNLKNKDKGLDDIIYKVLIKVGKMTGKKYKIDIDSCRDRQEIWANYINIEKNNSIRVKYSNIVQEWNYDKNSGIIPEQVSLGSNKVIWWKCKFGHEWEATVKNRVNGNGCPYCANKKVLKGYNDLQTIFPNVAQEWNYEKNDGFPSEYTKFSGKKVWWKCKMGHEWEATICKRAQGGSCPYCSNKKVLKGYNDLQTRFPMVAQSWNYKKNTIEPSDVFPFSNKKVWWRCNCGFEWEATINSRSRGNGCPRCSRKI